MEETLNILMAYPYYKIAKDHVDSFLYKHKFIKFVLDSGAFTAWKSGNPIQIEEYCDFLLGLDPAIRPWRYFTLDVIGDPHGTRKNYEFMLSKGLTPVPIFTRGEDISVLDYYYQTSDVVGIGGLVGTRSNKGFVKGIMKHVGDRRVHWLGFTNGNFIASYRPYMCDTGSWLIGSRFGFVDLYLGNFVWQRLTKKDHYLSLSDRVRSALAFYEIDPYRCLSSAEWRTSVTEETFLYILCGRSFVRYQLDLFRKYNVNYFVVAALFAKHRVNQLIESFLFLKDKGY